MYNPFSDKIACPIEKGWLPKDMRDRKVVDTNAPVAVARSVSKKEMMLSQKAIDAMDAEWARLREIRTWVEADVKDWHEVQAEARQNGETVHIGRLFPILVEKNSELDENDPNRKFKGRVVFDGSYVRDQDRNVALFQELSSCPFTMQAGKAADCYGRLDGHCLQQADAKQAYT